LPGLVQWLGQRILIALPAIRLLKQLRYRIMISHDQSEGHRLVAVGGHCRFPGCELSSGIGHGIISLQVFRLYSGAADGKDDYHDRLFIVIVSLG